MEYTCSAILSAQLIVNACYNAKIKHVVVSPGSRNAPLIISFGNHPKITTHSIPDERSAGYYALGMARSLNEPVALICTSGTATLNYAPALAEAYYQEIPVVAITADRPPEWIDQEDGQTIRQNGIFKNFVRYATSLLVDEDENTVHKNRVKIDMALEKAINHPKGPVHLNIPFREPLYNTTQVKIPEPVKSIDSKTNPYLIEEKLAKAYEAHKKIMLLVGVNAPDNNLNAIVNYFADNKGIVVLAPPTSNLHGRNIITTPETVISAITNEQELTPELLITIGGPVVSKATKLFLRKNKPAEHWDVDLNPLKVDTYRCLTNKIVASPVEFLNQLKESSAKPTEFQTLWLTLAQNTQAKVNNFIKSILWSDLFIYYKLFELLETPVELHLSNSTPVRYGELFPKRQNITYYGNRGTSGIDGSLSTAAGAATVSTNRVVLITGDLSFVYDSNALWNKNLPNNLTIILINNQGGNIFRIIPGPGTTNQLELFEANHPVKNESLCQAFHVNYQKITDQSQFSLLTEHFNSKQIKPMVFEIFTEANKSAEVYRELFHFLKTD